MIESTPLLGKTILIPRGKGQAKPFSDLVRQYGGVPVEIPLIAFRPVTLTAELRQMINDLHTYDWLILTSNVAVNTFFSIIGEKGKGSLPKIAVIGARTKEILLGRGVPVDFTPKEYVAEGFVEEFLPLVKPGMKVLIPKGNLARDFIAQSLSEAGANVTEIVIYETFAPEESKNKLVEFLEKEELDVLTFTSPSTIDHFMEIVEEKQLQDKIKACMIAVIGPVSKNKAIQHGLTVDVCPQDYTVKDMLLAVIDLLNQTTTT
ncbi:uroporphyrinogen-III synthase [Bacillus sp. DNRA2]|uniref:uroporphyrinogen-III synthase n=1 Tax=Bacillus sp. DNRA2 TaxID=2723053 RepID=UPI00145E3D8A|nr:uroporphyrinogen-III synthase [Bacillus sp. DNRA2]NMD70515.1 uroporphyrinogen-III synthase [Bacillus sp. DNRA2]